MVVDMLSEFLTLLNALFIIAAIALSFFVFLGPLIEMLFNVFLSEVFYEEDEEENDE